MGIYLPQIPVYSQISNKILNQIPDNFKISIVTQENEKGLLISFKQCKKGKFIEASEKEKLTLMTTMLLGSGTLLYDYLLKEYSEFKPVVLQPNGFTRTSFKIKYEVPNGQIFIMRIMNGNSSSDFMAAENPKNYSLIYAFNFSDEDIMTELQNKLIQLLEENEIFYQIPNIP